VTTAVKSKPPEQPTSSGRSAMDQIPEALKNNSSICITTASKASTGQTPAAALSPQAGAERPPRPPTVDLTAAFQEGASQPPPLVPAAGLNKPQTCHTCNKHFSSFFLLNAHIGKAHAGAAQQKIQFKLVLFFFTEWVKKDRADNASH
jgi:hypothetical protein